MISRNAILKVRRGGGIPRTWTRNASIPNKISFEGCDYGNGTFVAVGATVWTSPGPTLIVSNNPSGSWTRKDFIPSLAADDSFVSVVYADGIWTAGTARGRILTTVNPFGTWTINPTPVPLYFQGIRDVNYGNGVWVAIMGSGSSGVQRQIYTTSNPAGTWNPGFSWSSNDAMQACVYGNGVWTGTGIRSGGEGPGIVWTTNDATSTWNLSTFTYPTVVGRVDYGNGNFVGAQLPEDYSTKQYIVTTNPTSSWTRYTTYGTSCVRYENDTWLMGSNRGTDILSSLDTAGPWNTDSSDLEISYVRDFAFGNGYWIAVANVGSGLTYQSNLSWAIPGI